MLMALAKKIVKKVAPKKRVVKEKVIVKVTCESCNGRGLLNSHTLCGACEGSGQK
jgi:DnaJ-class molecular chaperone